MIFYMCNGHHFTGEYKKHTCKGHHDPNDNKDSQENRTQELFGSPEPITSNHHHENKVLGLLSDILKEQKKLRDDIEKLSEKISSNTPVNVKIEGSGIEKEYIIWLKDYFSKRPWIQFTEQDVQLSLKRLVMKAGWKNNPHALAALSSYGFTKFTYYRNQIRSKMVSNRDTDVESLPIKDLHCFLWKNFLSPTQELYNEEREHLTLLLRSFCYSEKLFRHQNDEKGNFWTKFSSFFNKVMEDQRTDKWTKLQKKEEKRIRNYVQSS